jgi:hypothetical protein
MSNPNSPNPGFPYQPPVPTKSGGTSVVKVVLIVLAVLTLACVCCAAAGYYFFYATFNVVKEVAATSASKYEVVRNEFGDLEAADLAMSFEGIVAAKEQFGRDCLVFTADGPLGSGDLIFDAQGGGNEGIGPLIAIKVGGKYIEVKEEGADAEAEHGTETDTGTEPETATDAADGASTDAENGSGN